MDHETARRGANWSHLRRVWVAALLIPLLAPVHAQSVDQVSAAGMKDILAQPLMTPAIGSAHADVTIVEYFDYNCPVCKRSEGELRQLVASDPKVRLIYKDWPIFGAVSAYAAYASFAAAELGQYTQAHRALMSPPHALDSRTDVDAALRAQGLDLEKIRANVERHKTAYSAVLTRNEREANALGLRGTPGLIVGDVLVPGYLELGQLRQLIAEVRRAGTHGFGG